MKFSLCVLGLLLAGCATVPSGSRTLYEHDAGGNFAIPVGTALIVQLPANPSTGYDWKPSALAPGLKLMHSSFVQNPAPAQVVGVGGMDTFRFHAEKAGAQVLELNYVRAWEKGIPPAKTVRYNLNVQP